MAHTGKTPTTAQTDEAESDVDADLEGGETPDVAEELEADRPLPVVLEKGLAPRDALQRYMAEVTRHPLLTREQENELAWRYYKDPEHNVDAAYKLVTANLRLVVKIAHQY